MIRSLLVANRGEIARRVLRTCHDLGIEGIAVFSEADADLPFVREADRAVCIGPGEASSSYLSIERVLAAARATDADAIHPGYGFLAENPDFARAVADAGFLWIGPPAKAIEAMADKGAARQLAEEQGVPTVPGYVGSQEADELAAAAGKIGYPVLIKAVAGGGGRGMRRVDDPGEFADALASARREAESAFGNGDVILEKYVLEPRHVEVQVFADALGTTIHLGERECSVQRRHQKIVEEAPSPAVDDALRARMGADACRVAAAAGYVGAGTVEFILAPDGSYHFLEMNTRLQVEHPVTELVTGLDLVALQIRVAEGEPLPLTQDEVRLQGHAIEVRLYAEDPLRDYLPATGTILRLDVESHHGIRVDAGFEGGNALSPWYDSMVAKIIAHGEDRFTANRRLRRAIDRAWMPGVVNNLPLLRQVLANPAWRDGALHTGFLVEQGLPTPPPLNLAKGAIAATALGVWERQQRAPVAGVRVGWRLYGAAEQVERYSCGPEQAEVRWTGSDGAVAMVVEAEGRTAEHEVVVHGYEADHLQLSVDGVRQDWRVLRVPASPTHATLDDGDTVYVHTGHGEAFVRVEPRFPAAAGAEEEPGSAVAPTPGTVIAVDVEVGQAVEQGAKLVVLEAMKMEHAVVAGEAGTVAEVRVAVGDAVDEGALLVRIEAEAEAEG